jgi:hypothetical protein
MFPKVGTFVPAGSGKVERDHGLMKQRNRKLSKRKLNLLSENFKDLLTVA